jgi:hypothetical protein
MATSKGVSCLSLFILQCEIQFSSNAFRVLFILCVVLGRVSAASVQSFSSAVCLRLRISEPCLLRRAGVQ